MAQPQLQIVRPPRVDDPISIEFMYTDLARSGLTPQDIDAYPIDSNRYGFAGAYCIPYSDPLMYRTRHDRKVDKYLQPRNKRDIWVPSSLSLSEIRASDTLYIIEGEKKAARFLKEWPDTAVIGIGGAWNFLDSTEDGTKRLLPALQECLRPNKRIIAIFDGDILTKAGVQMAATTLRKLLQVYSCNLEIGYPPVAKGVDDWLQETQNAKLTDVQFLPFDKLEESRKQLFATLECQMNDGKLILNELNAQKILDHYFSNDVYRDKRLGLIYQGNRTSIDDFEMNCIEYMQGQINAYYKTGAIRQGAAMVLRHKTRDLLQELVRSVEWDGVDRLNYWGSLHFDSIWPEWANEWGRILMTGLGLRILSPGTKADKVCILVGSQGIGKSTFFEDLSEFNNEQFYYACTSLASSTGDANRTQGMMFSRSVIVDLAEGVVFETKKQTLDTVKQVLTQRADEYRIPYSKSPLVEPRGFIFVGTTNRHDQLSDLTGSRRYMYLHAHKIHKLPYNEKLQILAEVVAKADELIETEWWEEKVDLSTMPDELRNEDNRHIKSAQSIVNGQFTKGDASIDYIRNILDSEELLRLKDSGEMFISSNYIAARAGIEVSDTMSVNMWGRKLSALASSPEFPYELEAKRLRMSQLGGATEQVKSLYMSGIMNNQMMVVGYIVRKR